MIKQFLCGLAFIGLIAAGKWAFAAQQTLTAVPSLKTGNALSTLGTNVQGNINKQGEMNTELYTGKADSSCFASAEAFNACFALDWSTGGSQVWPAAAGIMVYGGSSAYGDSLTLVTTVGATGADTNVATEQAVREAITTAVGTGPELSVSAPLNLNETTGVLSLTPWASQAALETWLGWSFAKDSTDAVFTTPTIAGASYPVETSAIKATGDINIDGASADHYYFSNGADAATYTPVITTPPASGKERGIILTVGGGAGVITMTWTNVSFIGTAGAATTTASKYSHYACFIPSSGNAKCKIIAEASDN